MGSEASERMLALLKELAVLKELDREYEHSSKDPELGTRQQRQQRQQEIAQQIKDLADAEQRTDS